MRSSGVPEHTEEIRLPDKAYLEHLRISLNKFRFRKRLGFLSFVKLYLFPIVDADPKLAKQNLSVDSLKRRLEYWAGNERGELRDAYIFYLIERFFEQHDPKALDQFYSKENVKQTGRIIAEFVSVEPQFRDIHIIDERLNDHPRIEPRTYGGIKHYRLQKPLSDNDQPDFILLVSDCGENNFYQASFFQYASEAAAMGNGWRIYQRYAGFFFPFSVRSIFFLTETQNRLTLYREPNNWKTDHKWSRFFSEQLVTREYHFSWSPKIPKYTVDLNSYVEHRGAIHFFSIDHPDQKIFANQRHGL